MRVLIAAMLSNWKTIVVWSITGAIVAYWGYRNHLIAEYSKQIDQLTMKQAAIVSDCNLEKSKLVTAINNQNEAISVLQSEGNALKEKLAKNTKRQQDVKQSYDKYTQVVLTDPKPKDCQMAINYLVDGTKDLQWNK